MVELKLGKPWSYRTPLKTIDYPAGTHEVFQYVADAYAAQHKADDSAPQAEAKPDEDARSFAVNAVRKRKDG